MIKSVLLQNFMSYENSLIPLKNGLNLICGPNGAGKSSILLAISIVLGQTYTERSRKLSDFVRWGKDQARITLQIENLIINGKKPFPNYRVKLVNVTRVLKRNGAYFYLIQGNKVPKNVVLKSLERIGLNPDNMLIIMHQLMVIKFSSVSPQDKLKMLEEAIGFQSYRQNVLEASERLKNFVGEERSLISMLETTKETHDFWKKEYEKYVKKKRIEQRLRELQCELAWAKAEKKENSISQLEARLDSHKKMLNSVEDMLLKAMSHSTKQETSFKKIMQEYRRLEDNRSEIARGESSCEVGLTWAKRILGETENEISTLGKGQDEGLNESESEFLKDYEKLLLQRQHEMESTMRIIKKELKEIRNQQASFQKQLFEHDKFFDKALAKLIQAKVNAETLSFKKNLLRDELKDMQSQIEIVKIELEPILKEAHEMGPRIESIRRIIDITRDLSIANEQYRPLASISEDVERMFKSYSSLYKELKEKAGIVAKNRKMTMIEVAKRTAVWRKVMNSFLSELNIAYDNILTGIRATGFQRLTSEKEIENAGLELLVGFGGREPVSLDSLAQSGGERSVALMAFLLALQQYIPSPFRAIDEFDVHMDPKNREVISDLIISSAKKLKFEQYVAITPGQIKTLDEDVHVIIVQNIGGSSTVSEFK